MGQWIMPRIVIGIYYHHKPIDFTRISYTITCLKMKYEEISQRYAAILICKLGKSILDVNISPVCSKCGSLSAEGTSFFFHVYINKNCRSLKQNLHSKMFANG
jgi:hypothetical protein